MTTVSTADPQFQSAIQACAVALHRMADYELDPPLQRRIHELGERKEFLTAAEHEELLALVDFVHKRTIEKLVSFGTRHTLSSQTDPKRGIGAALAWGEAEFGRYSAACGWRPFRLRLDSGAPC